MSSLHEKSQMNAREDEDIAMDGKAYDEAIDNANEILLGAMLGVAEELVEEGRRLDLNLKKVVFEVARCRLVRLYEVYRAMLVSGASPCCYEARSLMRT